MLALQPLSGLVTQIAFKVNQQYIARTMCINRFKPKMNCKGTCVLSRQLKKAAEQQSNPVKQNKEQSEVLYFIDLSIAPSWAKGISEMTTNPFPQSSAYHESLFSADIFHPPRI
ncbi:MAG: hypothetical protein JNN12_12640 [Bacteroidetes Order II. Incertae sedis bacterium]|nr:hypothetical protein [Bacteroidetes Order II. bacterium]